MESLNVLLKAEVIWFLIGLILLVAEFGIPGLIIVFFGIGAWITSLSCLIFDPGLNVQIIIFIISSILSLVLLRNSLKKLFHIGDKEKDDELADEFIGKTAVVGIDIDINRPGKINFNGTQWEAKSNHKINKGQVVKITDKENITLIVEPLDSTD